MRLALTLRGTPLLPLFMLFALAPVAWGAEPPSLAQARALHNSGDYDGAIAAAAVVRVDPVWADAAALVSARAQLERYRLRGEPDDLIAARASLTSVHQTALSPRDQVDLLVGIGQALYLGETFGAAAALFDAALNRTALLSPTDRLRLLDWWASALERQARLLDVDRRPELLDRIWERMTEAIRQDPGNTVANYWLAAVARDKGDTEGAWHAAVAGWVRAILHPETASALRADLDRLVTEGLIPERGREDVEGAATLRVRWESLKARWR